MRLPFALALSLLAAAPAAPSAAQGPVDPAFLPQSAEQYPKARQRAADQASNPAYLQLTVPRYPDAVADFDLVAVDPFRADWGTTRGEALAVQVPNRYGVAMQGTLYGPRDDRKHPGVILLSGGGGPEEGAQEFAHDLAESGYVVLGLEAQGDGATVDQAPDPVPSTPENEYCRPGNFGDWQAPQELGIAERSQCAGGYDPPPLVPDAAGLADSFTRFYQSALTEDESPAVIQEGYDHVKARKTFAALDAAAWLRSAANPWRDRLSGTKLGIAGHSLGAHAAALAGNGDPLKRFGAVVSWDGFGSMAPTAEPRVPTLFFQHELDYGTPKRRAPRPLMPSYEDAERFRAAGVPTGVVVPDGSTHQDFTFLDYAPLYVGATAGGCVGDCLLGLNASRDGTRVAVHYTRAWFDHALKGDKTAVDRLHARTYPESADATSIGQGLFTGRGENVPYEIGGETAEDHLSPILPSFLAGRGIDCADLRQGC